MKVFYLEGGLGRVISALPAFMKYYKNNLEEEWYIFIHGWQYVTIGIPELQTRTFDPETKGVWENILLKADEIVTPEPYRLPNYYKGNISLAEAFDEIINKTDDHSDLDFDVLKLSQREIRIGKEVIYEAYKAHKKEKTILINPYGSSALLSEVVGVYDMSIRSIPEEMFIKLSELLSKDYNLIYMGYPHLLSADNKFVYSLPQDIHMRNWMGVISQVDYIVGCDSAAQHIARCFNTRGCVIMGGTNPTNVTYPDHFRVIQRKTPVLYPMRLSQIQMEMAENLNRECIEYTDSEIIEIYEKIKEDVESI